MALSDAQVRSFGPKPKPYKKADCGGLYLLIQPNGSKLWRLKYYFNNKPERLSLGIYPSVSLKDARLKREEGKRLLSNGINPSADRRGKATDALIAAKNTFGDVGGDYLRKREGEGLAGVTLNKSKWLLSLFGQNLLKRPISEIEAKDLLEVLYEVQGRGLRETAARMRSLASRVFKFAIATQRAKSNPASDLEGALIAPNVTHRPALIEPKKVGEVLRSVWGYGGQPMTVYALQLLSYVFVRPGELRHAEWSEIDLDAARWCIPKEKMKGRKQGHEVPLSDQAIQILRTAKQISGNSRYVFPAVHTPMKPMSENTMNDALKSLGYKGRMTSHGFRSTASTLLNESGHWSADAIEKSLAHSHGDKVRATYHRGKHWDERVRLMQWYADYLDTLRSGMTSAPQICPKLKFL